MISLRKNLALFVILSLLSPVIAGAIEFKEGAVPEIPKMVPMGPGIIGVTILPTSVPTINTAAEIPSAAVTAIPQIQATPEAKQPDAVTQISQSVAPQLEAIAKPETGSEASAGASQNATTILQGGKSENISGGSADPVVAATGLGSGTPTLAKNDGAKSSAPAAPPSSTEKAKGPTPINSMLRYKATRWALAAIATHFGAVYSMPPASPELTKKIIEDKARNADVVFSDIDDTLTKWNTVLPRSQAENVEGVLSAGKVFAAITDRPDKSRPGGSTLGALDSFASLHENKSQGLIVATNGGGKIYEFDKDGKPQLIFEEPSLPEAQRPLINEAAEVVKSQLAANGTEIEAKNPGGSNPYGHTLIFKGGTPEATVKKMAHLFEAELKSRGLEYEVEGRMAKDPSLPPYITFSKLTKALAVERIIEVKKLQGKKMLAMGDSMYAPVKPTQLTGVKGKLEPWALKLGAALSGQDIPLTGNRTDANMEHGNMGMTMLSVGMTGDPRMKDGWVLGTKGPDQTAQILIEAARKPAPSPASDIVKVLAVIALAAAMVGAYVLLAHGLADYAAQMEQQLQQDMRGVPTNTWPF